MCHRHRGIECQCGRSYREIGKYLRKNVLDLSPRERFCTRSGKGGVPPSSGPPKPGQTGQVCRAASAPAPTGQQGRQQCLHKSLGEGCWPLAGVWDLKRVKNTNSAAGLQPQQGWMDATSPLGTAGWWCPKPRRLPPFRAGLMSPPWGSKLVALQPPGPLPLDVHRHNRAHQLPPHRPARPLACTTIPRPPPSDQLSHSL